VALLSAAGDPLERSASIGDFGAFSAFRCWQRFGVALAALAASLGSIK